MIPILLLLLWMTADFVIPRRSSLTQFDGRRVGELETAMWRSDYGHQPVKHFAALVETLREQHHVPFWRACLGAYHAARAALVFQKGRNRGDYELALPKLIDFYLVVRRSSEKPFPVYKAARLELEGWIVRRERAQHAPGDLERWLAELQSAIYQRPAELFADHAKLRAEAMRLRDEKAESGGVAQDDWRQIRNLLERSWTSLQSQLTH
jgi:hypothetical protein